MTNLNIKAPWWLIGIAIMAIIVFNLLLWAISVTSAHAQAPAAQDVCVARWEWNDTVTGDEYWEAPFIENVTGILDLRSRSQAGAFGGIPAGYSLFAYDAPMGSTGMHCLGSNLDAAMTLSEVNTIAVLFGKPMGSIEARNMRGLIAEVLTSDADPTGSTFSKPVRVSRGSGLRINLGGYGTIVEERFSYRSDAFAATLAVRMADYTRRRLAGESLTSLRRWTGYDMQQFYGRMDDEFLDDLLPTEYVEDGWEAPSTTVGDTFTDTDGTQIDSHTATGPNGGFGWTLNTGSDIEIQSNQAEGPGNNQSNYARADSDLSSDDMYSEVDATVIPDIAGRAVGPLARYDVSADDGYRFRLRSTGSGNGEYRIDKKISGTTTNLVTSSGFTMPSLPVTVRIEVDGSNIEGFEDGVSKASTTDSDVTGYVRAGIYVQPEDPGNEADVDNFEAADLAVSARRIIIVN